MSETPAELWKRGHADGLARRRDDEIYALDTADARMYRDGHRMGRRELEAPPAPILAPPVVEVAITFRDTPKDRTILKQALDETPSAFSDPIPGKHKTKRAKPVDPDQSSFL